MNNLRILGGLALQAVASLGQQAYQDTPSPEVSPGPPLFHYHGCAEVDLSGFGDAIAFSDGTLTHAACQTACEGHSIAALFSNACRCGDDSDAFSSLDDSVCDYPCMGDPAYGMCGSQCPTNGPSISTIYITSDVLTTEFEVEPPGLPASVPVEIGPSSSEDPPLVPQVTSDPPSLPSDPPAEVLSVVWESTTAPDITTQFTTERRTSATYDEITLFLTAHTTASRASSSTSESETPNVERDNDDPPTPSQVLQADAGGLMDQNILYMGALAFVVAAAV